MKNMLLEKIEYKVEETPRGDWRRFAYPNGGYFAEFRSHSCLWGLPLLHYTRGRCPETGTFVVAKGIIAIGRLATGVIAVGQASAGVIAIGQAALGLLFCLAQGGAGIVAVGQVAIGALFGGGQIAIGMTAVGQLALGKYVLAQFGIGRYLWTPKQADPLAVEYFQHLWNSIKAFL